MIRKRIASTTARLASVAVLVGLLAAPSLEAEIVVFRGGDTLKVTGYEVGPEKARLTLSSGGVLTVSIRRLERIVDDEIVPQPEVSPESPVVLGLRFRDGSAPDRHPYAGLITDTARRHDVNPELVAAVMTVESALVPDAVSHKGARGLMQLMPATAERFGVALHELFDPVRNVEAGVGYLRWLADRFGDATLVVAAYNAGEGAVERYDGVPPYRETRDYVAKVLGRLGVEPAVVASAGG